MAEADTHADDVHNGELPLEGPGDRLRIAREKAELTVEQVAAETRIPERHLHLIDAGSFSELPGRTYAVGFSRNYARAVGVDEGDIADAVRAELGVQGHGGGAAVQDSFEPGDPARVPSRGLAWFGLAAAVLLVAGLFAFYRTTFLPGSGPGSILTEEDAAIAAQAEADEATLPTGASAGSAAPNPSGAVVFTSTRDGVWVRFSDAAGERLMEKEMAMGETYTVPVGADGPTIRTGQPAAFDVTIGGRPVPKISEEEEIVSGIEVTAQALLARPAPTQPAPAAPPPAT